MKKSLLLAFGVFFLILICPVYAVDYIDSCVEVESNHYYKLTSNISASGGCFLLGFLENVTIDCDGYSILGDGTGNAIYYQDSVNVTIKNCKFENWGFYIYGSGPDCDDIYVYNNYIDKDNVWIEDVPLNLNTTLTEGENIIGQEGIGGNFWNETCDDDDSNGFCDEPVCVHIHYSGGLQACDYLPLAFVEAYEPFMVSAVIGLVPFAVIAGILISMLRKLFTGEVSTIQDIIIFITFISVAIVMLRVLISVL